MTSSRATTIVTIQGNSQPCSASQWQQRNIGAAHQHLIDQRIEIAAERAAEVVSAGEIAVEPVGERRQHEHGQTTSPTTSRAISANSTMAKTNRAAVSWFARLFIGACGGGVVTVAMNAVPKTKDEVPQRSANLDGAGQQIVIVGAGHAARTRSPGCSPFPLSRTVQSISGASA